MKSKIKRKSLGWALIIAGVILFLLVTIIKHFSFNIHLNFGFLEKLNINGILEKLNINIVFNVVQIVISPFGVFLGFIINRSKTREARNKLKVQLIGFSGADEFIEESINKIKGCMDYLNSSPDSNEFKIGKSELRLFHSMLKILGRRTDDLIKLIMQNQDTLDIARESVSASLLDCHKCFNRFVNSYYDYNSRLDEPEILEKTICELEAAKEGLYSLRSDIDAIKLSKLFKKVDFSKEDILTYLPENLIKCYNIILKSTVFDFSSRLCLTVNPGTSRKKIESDITEIMSRIIPDNNVSFVLDEVKETVKRESDFPEYNYEKEDYFTEKETADGETKLYIYFPMIYG